MTHFITGIIVPKENIEFAEDYIAETLEKYGEEYKVEPYIEKTKDEIEKEFEEWKEKINKKIKDQAKLEDYEEKYIEDGKIRDISLKEWVKSWKGYNKFDKDGNALTTQNPNSFYDWYEIGGRWNGLFYEEELGEGEELEKNKIPIKDLIQKYKEQEGLLDNPKKQILDQLENKDPNKNHFLIHIVVADGEVHRGRRYGWFGTSNDIMDLKDWKKKYLELLEKNQNNFMINLDAHV